jgi:hypothetical protein
MKNALFTLAFFSLLGFAAQAQAPQAFKYQTVVRDAAGNVQANTTVNIWIDIVQNGLAVYQENHDNLTTNGFGLVNLNVGRGALVSGAFDAIDWSIPTYIKVWLNGQEMGTSELLSVPYALYAANAAGGSGLPADATTGDLLYYDGTVWQRLTAGAAGTVLTMGADGLPFWQAPSQLDSLIKVTMTNGDVIYASPVDNSASVEWGGFGKDITALTNIATTAAANMDFVGEANTAAIVAQLGDNGGSTAYAAKVCDSLVAYGFDDWYLPAAGELNEMYLKLGPNGTGQITNGIYWSSSEYDNFWAWYQYFDDGFQSNFGKGNNFRCRCVRR